MHTVPIMMKIDFFNAPNRAAKFKPHSDEADLWAQCSVSICTLTHLQFCVQVHIIYMYTSQNSHSVI